MVPIASMISIFDYFGLELPFAERYRLIKQAGFDGVMLWWSDEFCKDYRDAPNLAREAGLFIENIHAPFDGINNLWLDNLSGEIIIDGLSQCVSDCAEYDIPTMVMHLSSGDSPPPLSEIGLDRLKRIAEKAEAKGVNVALENMRKTEYLAFAFEQIDSPRVGFCFDSGHQNCWSRDENLLERYGSRLMALHLHDNTRIDDRHLLPFEGTIDWPETMRKIARSGYRGATTLEVEIDKSGGQSAEEFLRLAFERAKKLEGLRRDGV